MTRVLPPGYPGGRKIHLHSVASKQNDCLANVDLVTDVSVLAAITAEWAK